MICSLSRTDKIEFVVLTFHCSFVKSIQGAQWKRNGILPILQSAHKISTKI